MNWEQWKYDWETALKCVKKIGGEVSESIYIDRAATVDEVQEVEVKLGVRLPESFRRTLLEFSKKVDFYWELPDSLDLPKELKEIFAGELNWDLDAIYDIEENRKGWVEDCFSNENDEYDRVWHNKLGFLSVANGDIIAFDMKYYPNELPVVYLSHDDGDCHGFKLGDNFIDFISRFSNLGCPGFEEWQIRPFITDKNSGIDTNCENAILWKNTLGL